MTTDKIGEGLKILRRALEPFVEKQLRPIYKDDWISATTRAPRDSHASSLDVKILLEIISREWTLFEGSLGPASRAYVTELRWVRNSWAHQQPFDEDEMNRALDTMWRLLKAAGSHGAIAELETLRGTSLVNPLNGLVRISRSNPNGEYHEESLDYEHTRKEDNELIFKCYDTRARIVSIRIHIDVIVEAAFGDVTPGHGMFPDEDR